MAAEPIDDDTSWDGERFRAIDDSTANLLRQLVVAVGAMFTAFGASRILASWIGTPDGFSGFMVEGALFTSLGCLAIYLTSARPIRSAISAQRQVIANGQQRLRKEAAQHRFASQVQNALEMGEKEDDALVVVSRAFTEIDDRPGELLLADSSRAHLRQAAVSGSGGGCGCGVDTPWACPAVRRGQTLRFPSSDALGACPRLADRGSQLSAVCVPVTVLGTPMGVIHMTGTDRDPVDGDSIVELEVLAQQAGSRIGVLRAMTSAELQAATDPLTGSSNRRSLESRIRDLDFSEDAYAVIMADLDHFKSLNDAHGHDTGDRALRLFADVLRASVRPDDVVCRYGGEEFVILIPSIDSAQAAVVAEDVRSRLASALEGGAVPSFSASFGVADSTQCVTSEQVIRAADLAMFRAKNEGRDRVAVAFDGKQPDDTDGAAPGPDPSPHVADVVVEGDPGASTARHRPGPRPESSPLPALAGPPSRADGAGDRVPVASGPVAPPVDSPQ